MSEQFSYPEFHLPLSQVRENSAHPRTPSRRRYEAMLKAEAERAKVSLKALLGRSNRRKHCYARFRVWRELREMGCSYTGIGQTAGRHHASILLGIRRIEKVEGQKDKPDEVWMDARS